MHPEVRQQGRARARNAAWPWSRGCSEPAAEEEDIEYRDMRRRFWVSLVLTVPVFVIAMVHVHGLDWLQLALATPVVLWGGWPFFDRGWQSLVHRSLNMFTLIAAGHRRRVRVQPAGVDASSAATCTSRRRP